jgi:Fur family peroxide stress response transcriptional regulator
MADADARFDELMAALREHDFRLTPQRIELVKLIASSDGHPSAAELYSRVKRRFPTMSHATVYKTLTLLKDIGQVLEINLRDDSHYDGNRPEPHPHLICMSCKRIVDGDAALDQATLRRLEKASGFRIVRSQIELHGLCPDCQRAS